MKNNPLNSLKRLSTGQLLLILAVLVAFVLYQYWTQRQAAESPQTGPTLEPTPVVIIPIPATGAAPQGEDPRPSALPTRPTASAAPSKTSVPNATPSKAASPGPTASKAAVSTQNMSDFDFFVLALSWSPDFCASSSGSSNPQQCSIGKKLGFVLHGLWPQYNQGYPSNCSLEKLSSSVKDQFPNLYPSDSLYDHEWEKHGTCTGLTARNYLVLTKQLKEAVAIPAAYRAPAEAFKTTPAQIRKDFAQANPSFSETAFEVNCSNSGRYLTELYVCFTREGRPMACSTELHKDALKSCPGELTVRNVR